MTRRSSKGMELRRPPSKDRHPDFQGHMTTMTKVVAPKPKASLDSWWARPEANDPAVFYALAHEAHARLNQTIEPKHVSGGQVIE
jgi:hypothetical protein